MLMAEPQDERRLIVNSYGRAALLVVVATLPILQMPAFLVAEEAKAIDHQELAAVLFRVGKVYVKCCKRKAK